MTQPMSFSSALTSGADRFLAEVLEHALQSGRRSPVDFLRHFSATDIMLALEPAPQLRAAFLTVLVGVREKTALRTPPADAGRLLEAALEEGDCDPEAIVRVFMPDDRIRHLQRKLVWNFLMEGEFWKLSRSKDGATHKTAQAHLAYMIDRGLAHGLHTHRDVVSGITVDMFAEKLPRGELGKLLKASLALGGEGKPYRETEFYETIPSTVIVDHIALPHLMEGVVGPMAARAGLVETEVPAQQGAEVS
jgi:hypothetical protein